MRKILIVPGILNLLTSIFWIGIGVDDNIPMLSIGMFLVVVGILCLMYSNMNVKELYEKRKVLFALGIVLLPLNFISAVILLIESDRIGSEYIKTDEYKKLEESKNGDVEVIPKEKTVNKQTKKLDILLKIGIIMVAISGVMIATTSWEEITDVAKMVAITIIGILFLGLSFFSDKKLKIRSTTITYWLLSMIAFSLSIFMIGNFQIAGDWFAINGEGEKIFESVLILCISLFSYITYKRFDMPFWFYITCSGMAIAISLIINFISSDVEVSILILSIMALLMNLIPTSEKTEIKIAKFFGVVISFVSTVLLVVQESNPENDIIIFVTAIIEIVNLIILAIMYKKDEFTLVSGAGIIAIIVTGILGMDLDFDEIVIALINRTIILIPTVFMCLVMFKNKTLSNTVLSIVLPLILISIIFKIDICVAIYVGCICLAMILFGYFNKNYKSIMIEGIIFLISDIVIQMSELWGMIPVWAYLLVGGLSLIGVVTVRELKNKDE